MRRCRELSILLSVAVLACDGPSPIDRTDRTDRTDRAIIDGTPESGFEAVGALVLDAPDRDPTGSFCTGTLIDPSWVLTAAHCIIGGQNRVPNSAPPSDTFYINFFIGENAGDISTGRLVPARRVFIHPGYATPGAERLYDIGLFELETPVTDVTPLPIHRTPLSGFSTDVFFVGFGQSDQNGNGSGIKRSATLRLDTIANTNIMMVQTQGGVCFGDSGGPALLDVNGEWEVIGVNSTVVGDPSCYGHSVQIRVDAYQTWINHQMENGRTDCRDDVAVCACDLACGDDGICDDAQCSVPGCNELQNCIGSCRDSPCAVRCLLRATPEANYLFNELNECVIDNCPDRDRTCVESLCRRDVTACGDGLAAVTGDDNCGALHRCASACEVGDQNCVDACFYSGTLEAQTAHEFVEACTALYCEDVPWSAEANTCRADQCRGALLNCMPNESCRMIGGTCAIGEACVAEAWAATYCRLSSGVAVGEACDPLDVSCVDGAVCIEDGEARCREVCTVSSDCDRSYGPCTPMAAFMDVSFSIGVCGVDCPDADNDGACDIDDCAPFDPTVHPGAAEQCDAAGYDENCDGVRNEGCEVAPGPTAPVDDGFCSCVRPKRGVAYSWLLLFIPFVLRRSCYRVLASLLFVVACGETEPVGVITDAGTPDAGFASQDGAVPDAPTIWAIQQGLVPEGTTVTLTEVVVSSPESAEGFFLSDGTSRPYAGIWVANPAARPTPMLSMGDVVTVMGTVREQTFTSTEAYATVTRTELVVADPSDVTITGTSTVPAPVAVSVYELALPEIAELYEGVIVRVDDVTITARHVPEGQFVLDGLLSADDLFVGVDFVWTSTGSRFTAVAGALHFVGDRYVLLPRTASDLTPASVDPLGCIPTGGYTICLNRIRWAQARAHCAAQGGRLPVLETPTKNVALGALSRVWTDRAFWIGVSDQNLEGEWVWVDGSTLTYDPWGAGEPNNAGSGEDCAHNNWRGNGVWNDANCNSRQAYACEFRGDGARCDDDTTCGETGRCDDGNCVLR